MKKVLHLLITPEPTPAARAIIDAQKKDAQTEVTVLPLTPENRREALEKIFEADSICVWPQG